MGGQASERLQFPEGHAKGGGNPVVAGRGREKQEGSRENELGEAARSGWRRVESVRRARRRCRPTIPGGRAGRRFVSGL